MPRFVLAALLTGVLAGALIAWPAASTPRDGAAAEPMGRGPSLFDEVFAGGASGPRVPYPFARLREALAARLGLDVSDLREVLLPLGRALQREAAAPDYFASPRHVLAVTREGGGPERPLAKDRLFIGYQPKAESLEIVSYNESAGRFDFQIVEDYAPGKTPRLRAAPRGLCESCHQNHAPVFPAAPWSETDANPAVHARLHAGGRLFQGLARRPAGMAAEHARDIESAVSRANLFPVLQEIWRDGCAAGEGDGPTRRCRAALLRLGLQTRLSASRAVDTASAAFAHVIAPTFRRSWARLWPAGLGVPAYLLPDRDPMAAAATPALDPLTPRPPAARWHGASKEDVARAVAALATLFADETVRRLDRYLAQSGRGKQAARRSARYRCAMSSRSYFQGESDAVIFRCKQPESGDLLFNGHVYLTEGRAVKGRIDLLELPGGEPLTQPRLTGGAWTGDAGVATLTLGAEDEVTDRSVRLADGWALESVRLSWSDLASETEDASAELPAHRVNGEAVLTFVDDVAPLRAAIDAGLAAPPASADLYGGRAFDRRRIMADLFARLGLPYARAPGSGHAFAAPAPHGRAAAGVAGRSPLQVYCGACHRTASIFPPNFLHGGDEDRTRKLARCAERIYYRLAMWREPAAERKTAPMPPASYLRGLGLDPETWRNGGALDALQREVRRIARRADAALEPLSVLGRPYGDLRSCLGR